MRVLNNNVLVLLLLATGLLASCAQKEEFTLLGKWSYNYWTLAGQPMDIAGLGNPVIDFKDDGSFVVTYGVQQNAEKWHLAADSLVMEYKDGKTQSFLMNKMGNDSLELLGKAGDMDTRMIWVRVKE